jgi:sarcosine oxidase, subunit beta
VESVDVVVIGGGCVGASAAFHLTCLGITDVLLLEAETLAAGSTSKAAGGVRLQYSDALNTHIALRSLPEFQGFEELTGVDIDFRQNGYLFLLDDAQHLRLFEAAAALQHSLGIPTELLGLDQVADLVPPVALNGLVGAAFCPWDGVATPESLVQGYATAARRAGARVRTKSRVVEIVTSHGAIAGVRTESGLISTRAVVLAAGVWSGELAGTAGLDLPVSGERRWIHYSESHAGLPAGAPLTIDFSSGFYFHRERRGLIFAGREDDLAALSVPATRRLPVIADTPIARSWSGLYDMSPDHNAMIGAAAVDGLWYATGFSGHGFQQSPAVGEHLAELVVGAKPTLDLTELSAERFATGGARLEQFVI